MTLNQAIENTGEIPVTGPAGGTGRLLPSPAEGNDGK